MRRTRTWTVSLPPDMSRLAQDLAREENRTKSELFREALRLYLSRRGRPMAIGAGETVARFGELAEVYSERKSSRSADEKELRKEFRGIKKTHERLKDLVA